MAEGPSPCNGYESEEEEKTPVQRLLYSARHGRVATVLKLLKRRRNGEIQMDINCKGTSKANLGWSPLHLASYFGHTEVVCALLEAEADVNVLNDVGDTPLHRAAYTGRLEAVLLLLRYNADVYLKNAEGCTARQTAKSQDIRDLIAATEAHEEKKNESQLLKAAREGATDTMSVLLRGANPPHINCQDAYGNTALHTAAQRGHKDVVILLLQNGGDTSVRNQRGETAYDLARDAQTARLLDVRPIKELQRDVTRFEGPLSKKSRFMGWRPFWVVIDKGVLSLFRTRADATTGTRRKGCKYLDNSRVECRPDVGHIFSIHFADESSFTFAVEPNLSSTVNRQKWENVLAAHIAYATQFVMPGWQDASTDEEYQEAMPLGSMQDTLREADAQQVVLVKQVTHVTGAITALANDRHGSSQVSLLNIRQQLNCILNTSQEMCSSLQHCLTVFTQEDQIRKLQLKQEQERTRYLQASLRVLAQEHHDLERSLGGGHRSPSMADSDNEDEFFDCDADSQKQTDADAAVSFSTDAPNGTALAIDQLSISRTGTSNGAAGSKASKWGNRAQLPVPMISRNNFSVWTFLKQCIGKELSKITMPVIFNEPISFLQRMTEYLEYSQLLNQAASCRDPVRRFEHVIAFAVSSAASNWERIGKPFNPLLGETYELDRLDLGFQYFSEQVSHHPPVSAFHVTSPGYTFHGSIHPKLKFWGKSVEVTPKGLVTLYLKEFDETYTWQNINCCIHNIIVGKLWIEHYGTMEIMNHKTKEKCVLNFKPSGWFGKDLHKVEGFLYDSHKKKVRAIYGKWVEALYSYDVKTWEKYMQQNNHRTPSAANLAAQSPSAPQPESDDDPMPERGSSCNLALEDQRILWIADLRPFDSDRYYNFTHFAMMLNEFKAAMKDTLPPTDSRLRPDMRKLEEGDLDGAASEKHRLEEKQRSARKDRKKTGGDWKPRWFKVETNKFTGKEEWTYQGKYWDRKWDICPDIF